jgi:hypothetical protein
MRHCRFARWLIAAWCVLYLVSPTPAHSSVVPLADLKAETLSAVITPQEASFSAYLKEVGVKTGKSVLVLGFTGEGISLVSYRNRPARELLVELADRYKTSWYDYDGFLLLYPAEMERHDARPKSRAEDWKELRRPVSGIFNGDFMGVVQQLGATPNVGLLPVGPEASQKAVARAFLPCTIAVRDRTLDEIMQVLTVVTGDPWDYWQETHVLCFTGRPLTGSQRKMVSSTIASSRFKRSITASQKKLIDTERGLRFSDLTVRQKADLAFATSNLRARFGAPVEGMVLRRDAVAPHLSPVPFVDVYSGATRLGSIRLF